ncbi:replication protein A 70 kDa DNA-binding subunit C [Spinacia oleracea]|uniref:Replication protein A 70 kDa DNA-binding subunit C n=1 Tax=Spinacia oleracea TaxID=3562 RepID=A0ABM3QRW2_SPIOL|nr:replication protein A 70 kDa DNA-binding subunit C-like [Spinacia oleracea]
MAKAIAMIKDINPTAENLTLQVRVVRLWTMTSFKNPEDVYFIDMVLLDAKGDKIQATIKKSLLRTFQPLLNEGELYTISNYRVGKNSGEYKPTGHPYKINFVLLIRVNVLHAANIPTYGFDLVPFDAIISNGLDSTCLVDVIGYLSGVTSSDDYMRNGIYTKQLTIQLEDLQKNVISCTLWNHYADELKTWLAEHPNCQVILIVQFAKIKTWQGTNGLSSSLFATRLHINSNVEEINAFKNSFGNGGKTSSEMVTQLSSHTSQKNETEFLKKSERKQVDEIRETQEVCYCVTLAVIDSIETENGWFYLACKKYYKKVQEMNDDAGVTKFWCDKCNTNVEPVPRFKVQIRVVDDSGSASFVLFDREVVHILGKSALSIREYQAQEGNLDSFPKDLDELLERKYLSKIRITHYNLKQNCPIFTVTKISDDENLIKSFQDANTPEKQLEHEEIDVTSKTVNVGETTITIHSEDMDENCSNSCITPNQKRSSKDFEDDGNLTSTEHSSNKYQRIISIKQEKDTAYN